MVAGHAQQVGVQIQPLESIGVTMVFDVLIYVQYLSDHFDPKICKIHMHIQYIILLRFQNEHLYLYVSDGVSGVYCGAGAVHLEGSHRVQAPLSFIQLVPLVVPDIELPYRNNQELS